MKSFKGYLNESILLNEAETEAATKAEQAICYQYNMKRSGKNHEESLKKAGITQDDFAALSEDLQEIGKKVAEDSKLQWGNYLNHAGFSNKDLTNHYKEGGKKPDKTPKTDVAGDLSHNISLKKAGGSQLMSPKAAEAAGVLKSAILHHDENESIKLTDGITETIETLKKQMLETSRTDLQVEVEAAKIDFQQWYIKHKDNLDRVKGLYSNKRDIEKHLKYELEYHGAGPRVSKDINDKIKKLPNWPKDDFEGSIKNRFISLDDFKALNKSYINDNKWNIRDKTGKERVLVSSKHRMRTDRKTRKKENITLNDEALKTQVTEVIDVAMRSKEWIAELEGLFSKNESLKKWVAYEAGSGLYKFTEKVSDGNSYKAKNSPVANKIVVFDNNGVKSGYSPDGKTVLDWAGSDGKGLVSNVSLSYKGSGKRNILD